MDLENEPKAKPVMVIGENLDLESVAELEQRIEALESEIVRVRTTLAAKKASRDAAAAFFR